MILFNSRTPSYSWLSAFHPCQIEFDELVYPSVENYYQALKCANQAIRPTFLGISPQDARAMGQTVEKVDNWSNIKVSVMRTGLQLKYSIPELKEMLLATGDEELVHLSPWDTFWGVDSSNIGTNMQGKLTMEIREMLANKNFDLF